MQHVPWAWQIKGFRKEPLETSSGDTGNPMECSHSPGLSHQVKWTTSCFPTLMWGNYYFLQYWGLNLEPAFFCVAYFRDKV
jgi:hypothetical protein